MFTFQLVKSSVFFGYNDFDKCIVVKHTVSNAFYEFLDTYQPCGSIEKIMRDWPRENLVRKTLVHRIKRIY